MAQEDKTKEELIEEIKLLQKRVAELEIMGSEGKRSEIYLKTMVDSLPAGVILIDQESHKIIEINSLVVKIFGMSKENIVGSVCHQFICPAEVDKCPITDLGQTVDNSERVLLNAKGERISIIKTAVSLMLDGRRYLLESFVDITERKKAEKALWESEWLLAQAQKLANLGSWKYDPVTGKTVWSEEMFRIYGLEPANEAPPIGVLAEMVHREDRQAWNEAIDKTSHTRILYSHEYRIIRLDGQCRWLLAHESSQAASKDTFPVFYGTVLDITERKKGEEALRASEIKNRTLLSNLPQKIFFKDKNSVYISCNENYARDLKIAAEEITGKTDYDFYPKELAEKYRADDKTVTESGKIEDIDEKYIRDGQEGFIHTVKTPVRDEQGNVIGILGIFWDITEKKKMETKEQKQLAELETFFKASVGREERIIELKKEVERLKKLGHW